MSAHDVGDASAPERGPVSPVSSRATLAPFAVAGPVLCAIVLIGVELTAETQPSRGTIVAEAIGVILVIAVNLVLSRHIGLRLDSTRRRLGAQVAARQVAEASLRETVAELVVREQDLRDRQHELTARNQDLDAIAWATTAVLSGRHAREAICQAALEVTGALAVLLFEPDPAGQQLVAVQTAGLQLPPLRVPVDSRSLTAHTYRTAKTHITADVVNDPDTDQAILRLFHSIPGGERLRATISLPVVHEGRTRAVLMVTLDEPLAAGDTRRLVLLDLLAADAALALSREDLTEELARQADTDPLTGMANRRRWDVDLAGELRRSTRSGVPVSVVTLDLDHFKTYNDTLGHPAGDALLRELAVVWRPLLRADDLLARLGGEEFAVLLPGCAGHDAAAVADKLRRAVPQQQTCSAGAVQHQDHTATELMAQADQALYRAKHAGRDRTCWDRAGGVDDRSQTSPPHARTATA